MEKALYCKWLAGLCLVMAAFGAAVMLVGYKAPTAGLVATVAVLLLAGLALLWCAKKL